MISRVVELVSTGPGALSTWPAGPGTTCWPRQTSGRGMIDRSPSVTMPWAPMDASSAGWNRKTTVPCHLSRVASMIDRAPSALEVCASCPQACMVGTRWPVESSWEWVDA